MCEDPKERSHSIRQLAKELGFSKTGIADLRPNQHAEHLNRWLSLGMAGSMTYVNRQANRRLHPASILPGAHTAVVVTRNYFDSDPPGEIGAGLVAKYARGRDYHEALRKPLSRLVEHMRSLGKPETIAKAFVDAGPVPERELAWRSGLGWIGKNSMLIDPTAGSFFFIAVVLTDLTLPFDSPLSADRCGTCTRCIDACPTSAIQEGRMVDSRVCVSYLTIEHRGEIEESVRRGIGNRVFGCDVCQDVCPWNKKFARRAVDADLALERSGALVDLSQLLSVSADQFHRRFGLGPMERAGLEGMRRNARIVIRNQR